MLHQIIDIFLHLDVYLASWSASMGAWLYLLLFLIVFAETGLVVTPFLPGDSLLFAVGALASVADSHLNVALVSVLLMLAAFLGDNLNYRIGRILGPKVFAKEKSAFFDPQNLHKTQSFYQRYGSKTVVIARFIPIVRTFAPFVAGVGSMRYSRFILFSLLASFLWIGLFVGAGCWFGNIPEVKRNFHIVIFSVIGISVLPIVISAMRSRLQK